jgi:hypothetical protein
MVTWEITKELGGVLAGIVVVDTMTADGALGAPFTAGQVVAGLGCDYTVKEVRAI